MSLPPPSPFAGVTLDEFGARFRRGELSARETTAAMLARIEALEPKLAAFVFVDPERALAQAEGIDRLWAASVDLGPLMGVPVAIKDLFSVANMPTMAGSRVNIADLVPPQGRFVTGLQRNGCIILGKTTTTEFALGGYNLTHRLPHNPCDPAVARMTGGSSHGSAVVIWALRCRWACSSAVCPTATSVSWHWRARWSLPSDVRGCRIATLCLPVDRGGRRGKQCGHCAQVRSSEGIGRADQR